MSTYHGNNGQVLIGANVIAEIVSFSFTTTARLAEDSAMNDPAATHISGKTEASGSITCHYDSDDADGQALLTAGASVTLILRPEGTGAGLVNLSVPAIINSVGVSVEQEGIVQAQFDYTRSGAHVQTDQA